jgi:hypothetical protein
MKEISILGILISDRIKESNRTQQVLSRHAHIISSRLGFHEVSEDTCSRVGFILLHLSGKKEDREKLVADLQEIGGLEIQQMKFNY